jgi:hypothetical protein
VIELTKRELVSPRRFGEAEPAVENLGCPRDEYVDQGRADICPAKARDLREQRRWPGHILLIRLHKLLVDFAAPFGNNLVEQAPRKMRVFAETRTIDIDTVSLRSVAPNFPRSLNESFGLRKELVAFNCRI